ncbi:MAG: hypothetical protein QM578_17250 [Pantoea sp.]|uniref:hypothetical protein n=1 Tax=Pantoea sp. TaxID=69393 RepID=UPI0039E2F7B4
MLRTYHSGLSPAPPSGDPEIITTTPVIVSQISSIQTNYLTPYNNRHVNSVLSPSVFPSSTSFTTHVTTSAANPALFTLQQRVENKSTPDGAHELNKLLKLQTFIDASFTVTADMSGSTNPVVTHFKNRLLKFQERGNNITKTMSRKAIKTYEINIKKIKRLLETVDDKSIGEFLQKILAIHQAKNCKMLKEYFKETDKYMEVYVKDNNTEQLRMLWKKIIYEGDNSLRDFLDKFKLWDDFNTRVKHMLETFDDNTLPSFIDRQNELYDELKTLCAPATSSQEKDNLHLHAFCDMPLDDKSVTAAIESLQQNQGLIFVLSCSEYGGKLLEQLNNYKVLLLQNTREKREKEIKTELERIAKESKTSQQSNLLRWLMKSIPFCNDLPNNTNDLKSKLLSSRTFGLDISASHDPGLKSIYDIAHAGVWKSLNELLNKETVLHNVVSALGIKPEVNAVTPEFMTDELSVAEALCVAHNLYSSRIIADNMSNLSQLYRIMKKKFLHPEIIKNLTFNCTDHQGQVVIKALMLAAVWQCSADPEMDWIAQRNILLGFADEKHARDIDATEQTVTVHGNHKIRCYIKHDHFDKIKQHLSNRISKKTLNWKFTQSIKLDLQLIKLINKDVKDNTLQEIRTNMVHFLFCEGDYSDVDFRPIFFRTKLASLLNVAPQKFLNDLAKINYTPSHYFSHHAHQSGCLLTEKQISNVDHLTIIFQQLQDITIETTTTLEHLETLEYIISFVDLVGLDDTEKNSLREELIAQKKALNQQPYNHELKVKIETLANSILENVSLESLRSEDDDELLDDFIILQNYFLSYRARDINDFYTWMQNIGLPLSIASKETITQELSKTFKDKINNPSFFSEAISIIVRELFLSPLMPDPQSTPQGTQLTDQLNSLTIELLEQTNNILQDEITKSIAEFAPGNDQATLNLQALCRMIDKTDAIEETLKEFIFDPNEKNTTLKKERLTQEQFVFLKDGLQALFESGEKDYFSEIEKLLEKMKESATTTIKKYVECIYERYLNLKKIFKECEKKTLDQLFNMIILCDFEKGIPSLIKMDADIVKRAAARLSKETFTLGDMDVASHADFLNTLNDMHKLSSSLLFEYFRLKPWRELVAKIVDGEIEYNDKRRKDLIFSLNASKVNAAIQEGTYKTEGEHRMDLYHAYCDQKDAIKDQQHADGRYRRDLWNDQMRIKSNEFLQCAIEFSDEFIFWYQPRYIIYKTIVQDGHKSVIIFSNAEFFQSEHIHEYEIGITMVRTKNADIMNNNKELDEGKILLVIRANNPNFKFVNTQRTRTEFIQNIGVDVIQGDRIENMNVGTFTQTRTLNTNTVISTTKADYMTGISSSFPTSGNEKIFYQEFFCQPDTLHIVPPIVAFNINREKQTFLPKPFDNPEPSTSTAAATAITSTFRPYRSSTPVANQLRDFVSPFTNYKFAESSLSDSFISELQQRMLEHLSYTISRDIVTINNDNQMTYYHSGGKVVSYDKSMKISAKDAKEGNYSAVLPEHIMSGAHKGNIILLKEDGHKYNGIQVQSTDAGFVSSVIPEQPDYRDSVINSKLHKLPEPVRPLVERMFPAVMNAAYTSRHGKISDEKLVTYPLIREFLEQLNKRDEQGNQEENRPGTSR